MTNNKTNAEIIADEIIEAYKTDTGIVMGIPPFLVTSLRALLVEAVRIGYGYGIAEKESQIADTTCPSCGIICQVCGMYIGQPVGFPRTCKKCKEVAKNATTPA